MSNYSLIKQLQETPTETNLLPEGVEYTQFTVNVNNNDVVVNIPLREAEDFESRIAEDKKYTQIKFRSLMREFRGIRQ